MNVFLLDLWHDLREKRMAPVAVILAVALLAVPVVLREKPEAEAPVAPPTASAGEKDNARLAVKALEEGSAPSSDLGVFDPKDPFKPLGGRKPAAPTTTQAPSPGGSGAQAGGGEPVTTIGGSSGGATPASGGSGSGGGGGSTGGGGGGGGESAPRVKTQRYTYVVDVTFKRNGRTRKVKGMRRLDMLPNESTPLLIFLGVSGRGNSAVFLVDSSLTGSGEGRCKPSASNCSFVYLGPGSEHEFHSEDGDTLNLRVDQIRRVKVSAAKANKSRKQKRDDKPADASAKSRRFVLGDLIDVVEVESSTQGGSSGGDARR